MGIRIVEVGPRDGLQNEARILSAQTRFEFVRRLAAAGVREIEAGAFVSPQWVPQMAKSDEVFLLAKSVPQEFENVILSALVPNMRGMQDAVRVGLEQISVFGSASESFSRKNINCTIEESLQRFSEVVEVAKSRKMRVRGYLSMCFGCPFEGQVSEAKVVELAERMLAMGMYEISIGDTIGVANPKQVKRVVQALVSAVGEKKLAMHFHDTRGLALANVVASLDHGIEVFDSSVGGLGGCPYAPSSAGNLATEDVVYLLHEMGLDTKIDLEKLLKVNKWIESEIGHELPSRVGKAGIPRVRPI